MDLSPQIKIVDAGDVLDIWSKYLWPNRASQITQASAIVYGTWPYMYDETYHAEQVYFLGAYLGDKLVGVNSCHRTGDGFRSRGLFVFPEYRGKRIGLALLEESVSIARTNKAFFIWTMPRLSAMQTYQAAGFKQISQWFETETSESNCYAKITLA